MNKLGLMACATVSLWATTSWADTTPSHHDQPSKLPDVTFCKISDPKDLMSAFNVEEHGRGLDSASYWASYTCRTKCTDWKACAVDQVEQDGVPVKTKRGSSRKQLAFVTAKMGGFLRYSSDGGQTVVFHSGAGGTMYSEATAEDFEAKSNMRTVQLVWSPNFLWGWYTRSSAEPATVVEQAQRPAAVLKWIHDNLGGGRGLVTIGASMGTVATLGPVLWYGLDPIFNYQIMIGGPPMWDVNASCGRAKYPKGYVPYVTGYCDGDGATMCQADAQCAAVGQGTCQMPAPLGWWPLWESLFDHLSASNRCTDSEDGLPYPPFDMSSMRFTAKTWTVTHHIDFLINRGEGIAPEIRDHMPSTSQILEKAPGIISSSLASARGGDEAWGLGHFPYVYNMLQPRANVSWFTAPGGHSSWMHNSDDLIARINQRLGLK